MYASGDQPTDDRDPSDRQWVSGAAGIETPDAATWFNERHKMLMEFVRPYLPPSGMIAEVGYGSAQLLVHIGLERPDLKLLAVDYENGINPLKVPDNSFDMVLTGGLLEHFVDPKPALHEMIRTLKPRGTFYAAIVPRKIFSLHRPMHLILGPKVYRTKYNGHEYAQWLRELGMVDVVSLSKGLYPPLFHRFPASLRLPIERAGRKFDGSWLADRLGYFFLLGARKPG